MSLFAAPERYQPLASRMRPRGLDTYIGQTHLLAPGKPLREAIESSQLHSMILWGPPGVGKTTLARLIAEVCDIEFQSISAVLSGVKDIRQAIDQARQIQFASSRKTLLFVDEVHRFNKSQQDAFLPHVEDGTVIFVGATTENPSFELNNALLSRTRVYRLQSLTDEQLAEVLKQAMDKDSELANIQTDADTIKTIARAADGDARRALNILEVANDTSEDGRVDQSLLAEIFGDELRRFDKGGDLFYEQISALHKSMRGSAPDAALYWFCRVLDGGADPRYIGRRLVRFASEDVGNADPRALELTLAALTSYERLGSPEGELALAQAVLYLASVPKSDAAYRAFGAAMALVRSTPSYEVPMQIRNAPTQLMQDLGYGADYRHAHNEQTEEGAYAPGETYFPDELASQRFYEPLSSGLEEKIRNRLARLRALDAQANESPGISGDER